MTGGVTGTVTLGDTVGDTVVVGATVGAVLGATFVVGATGMAGATGTEGVTGAVTVCVIALVANSEPIVNMEATRSGLNRVMVSVSIGTDAGGSRRMTGSTKRRAGSSDASRMRRQLFPVHVLLVDDLAEPDGLQCW